LAANIKKGETRESSSRQLREVPEAIKREITGDQLADT
jgi:hypothetical protein